MATMAAMVVGQSLFVMVVVRLLLIREVEAMVVVLLLRPLERLNNVMIIVGIHVIILGFTYRICPLMLLLRNCRSFLVGLDRY